MVSNIENNCCASHHLKNIDSSSRTMALKSNQPLTELSTSNIPEGKGQPVRKADNLTAICELLV
jgi:hypothetical protein